MTAATSSRFRLPLLDTRRLMVALLFILIFAMATRIPVDTDTWWHVRSGEWMLDNGRILMQDPFSFTREGQAWINHSWGAQLIMVLFYRALGNAGLAFYTAILATAGMAVVYLMCEGNVYVRAFVIVIAAAAAAVFWSARPQMTSFFLSTVTLYLLHLYKRKHIDRLWLLPLLMILWVNLHGGFAIGFILLFGMIGGEVLGRLFDGANPDVLSWRQIGKLTLITALCALALVVNPNTVQMWGYPFRTFGIGVLQQFIQEWNSPNFHGRETWPFIFLLLGTLAAVGLGSKRIDWTDLALVSGTAFMSLYAGRNIATFAIVAAPVLTRHLHALLEERGLRLGRPRPVRAVGLVINYLLLLLVLVGALLYIVGILLPSSVAKAQTEYLPVEAANYLNKSVDPATAGNLFNSYNWGGYLLFAAPQFKVFVDGRTDLYDDELLREWIDAATGKNWQQIFEKWRIGLVVIEKDGSLAGLLRSDAAWQEVYSDDKAAIFKRSAAS
ncbi:MAG: hypothetical protein KF726_16800 [Anaerolineae bacterium]|nr:hypothetical protein [Anaerolineae bacterium]